MSTPPDLGPLPEPEARFGCDSNGRWYEANGGTPMWTDDQVRTERQRCYMLGVAAASQWRPIETAPRSALAGQILTFRDYGGTEASFPARRGQHGPWFQTSFWSEKYSLWVGWPINVQPTHWMALPSAPTKEGG